MKPITATEFLKNSLTDLVDLFPIIRVRYEFDAIIGITKPAFELTGKQYTNEVTS